jgi:predicted ATPase
MYRRRPQWCEEQAFHTRLDLQPLARDDSQRLVVEVLQKVEDIPGALREMVVSSAAGNPFYMEELVKMLVEDGAIVKGNPYWQVMPEKLARMRVPPTLTGVLQARLEGLQEEERTILQQASVVGRVFWDAVVDYLNRATSKQPVEEMSADLGLAGLQEKEMVLRQESSAFETAQEFVFKNAILREVTYESVLRRMKSAYHALAAEWLIQQSGERAAEVAGLIADHLEKAGKATEAGKYLRMAAEEAAASYANEEAIDFYTRALAVMPESDQGERHGLLLARERVNDLKGARRPQAQDLAALEDLSGNSDDLSLKAEVALRRASYAEETGDYLTARNAARRATAWAHQAKDTGRQARGYLFRGRALWRQGDHKAARARLLQALELAQEARQPDMITEILRSLGLVAYLQADYASAEAEFKRALKIARDIGNRRAEEFALNNLGAMAAEQGDYSTARVYFEQGLDNSCSIGDRRSEYQALCNLGLASGQQGDYGTAVAYFERSLIVARETGNRQGEGNVASNLGWLNRILGNHDQALDYCQHSLKIAREIGDRDTEGEALTAQGHTLQETGKLEEAAATYRSALALRQRLGQQNLATEPQAGLARIALVTNESSEALTHVQAILAHLDGGGTLDGTLEPLRVYLTCYQTLEATGDSQASEMLATAYQILDHRANMIPVKDGRRMFLEEVPWHNEIVAAWNGVQHKGQAF